MADQDPIYGSFDIEDQLRRQRLLQSLPDITGQYGPQPTTMPAQPPSPQQPATITPWQQPPVDAPPTNPYQSQMEAINKNVAAMGQAGQDVATLKGNQPTTAQYPISKLRAALLMPLQILAGAGGRDTSSQYASIIRPGYNKAQSEYQAELDAAQGRLDALRETTKTQLEALKDEGQITNQQMESALKAQELKLKPQELEIRRAEIPPINQALESIRERNGIVTPEDVTRVVKDYYTAQEDARIKAENLKMANERTARLADDKLKRQEGNIAKEITAEQARISTQVLKPLETARENLNLLKAARLSGDQNSFARYMALIEADNALNAATHGSVRQNIGIIHDLQKSGGWYEYLKGLAQGILQPGKGSISDATMKKLDDAVADMDAAVEKATGSGIGYLNDLTKLDPTDPSARDDFIKTREGFYKPIEPSKPTAAATDSKSDYKPPKTDIRLPSEAELKKALDELDKKSPAFVK